MSNRIIFKNGSQRFEEIILGASHNIECVKFNIKKNRNKGYQNIFLVLEDLNQIKTEEIEALAETGLTYLIIRANDIEYLKNTKNEKKISELLGSAKKSGINAEFDIPLKQNGEETEKIIENLSRYKAKKNIIFDYQNFPNSQPSPSMLKEFTKRTEPLLEKKEPDLGIRNMPLCHFKESNENLIKKSNSTPLERTIKPIKCINCGWTDICHGSPEYFINKLGIKEIKPKKTLVSVEDNIANVDIILVNPKFHGYDIVIEPLSLEYIASNLIKNGFKPLIFDFNVNKNSYQKLRELIDKTSCRIIGLSCFTLQVNHAYEIGNQLKKIYPNIKLIYGGNHQPFVYGGMHTSTFPEEPFEKGSADFIVIGEGEMVYPEILKRISKKVDFQANQIKGLLYKKDNSLKGDKGNNNIKDLDQLPFPARDLIDINSYQNEIHIKPYHKEKAVSVIASRGCYGKCSYCVMPNFYNQTFRQRSPENVINEIKEIIERLGITNIHFHDDDFTTDKQFVMDFCNRVIQEKINIRWICLSSISFLVKNKEIIPLMSEAGCVGVELGLETGDETTLKNMEKKQKYEDAISLNQILRKNKITPMFLMISFFPGDSINATKKTVKLMEKISSKEDWIIDYMKSVHLPNSLGQLACPYPGTRFHEEAKKEGRIFAKKYDDYNRQKITFLPHTLLEDIPIKKKISKKEFLRKLLKNRKILEFYILDNNLVQQKDFKEFCIFLYSLLNHSDGKRKIKEFKGDIRYNSVGFKFLAGFDLIDSAK